MEDKDLFPELYEPDPVRLPVIQDPEPEGCTCPSEFLDFCPYEMDVNGQEIECDCCPACSQRCADEI